MPVLRVGHPHSIEGLYKWRVIRPESADISRVIGIRTCGQNKLHAHVFAEERFDVRFEAQWIDNSSMADRDPILTVDKNDQRPFSRMAWINKRPTTGTI